MFSLVGLAGLAAKKMRGKDGTFLRNVRNQSIRRHISEDEIADSTPRLAR